MRHKLAREHRAVAFEPAPPQRRVGGVVGKLLEIHGELGKRCLDKPRRCVDFRPGFASPFSAAASVGPLIARLRPLFGLALGRPAGDPGAPIRASPRSQGSGVGSGCSGAGRSSIAWRAFERAIAAWRASAPGRVDGPLVSCRIASRT